MKKSVITIIVILLIIISISLYFILPWLKERKKDPYATIIKPRIESMAMVIKELDKEKTTMDMKILVDNPAPIGFKLDSLSYKMYIEDVEVMKSSYPKSVNIEGNDSTWITLPVTIFNKKLVETLKKLEGKTDSVEYKMKTQVFADIPLKDGPLNLEFAKKAPLFIIPKLKLKDVKIKKIGLNETKAIFSAEIENPNSIPFECKSTSYKVKIDKDKMMEGKIDTAIVVPKKSKKVLDFPIEISLKEAGETMLKMLTKPSEVDYQFNFKTTLIADDKMIKDSKISVMDEGKLKELIKNK